MRRYLITLEGHTFDVKVLDDPRRDRVRVEVDGEVFTVGVEAGPAEAEVATAEIPPAAAPSRLPRSSGTSEAPDSSAGTIAAPLPGVIKSIAVRPGQAVAEGDGLLVIDAMKMDNVIRAPCAGTVSRVHVTEGCQVAHGEPLLEIS